jgi:predicted transcriptional regulator
MPGKYHIKVNTVMKLQITPRDEKRLKRRASELLALALSEVWPNLSDIAERLSYLQDTVAINAFERLLRETSSRTQRFAVKGLMRIADLQSTHLLIKYQDKTEASGDRFITHALNKITNNSNDPEIVALAKSAADKYRIRSKAAWFNH